MNNTRNFLAPFVAKHSLRWAAIWACAGILILSSLLAGCTPTRAVTPESLKITIEVDGKQVPLQVAPGATVTSALQQAGVTLNNLDRVEPASYSLLSNNAVVKVTRVREVFTVKENTIPFERQTVHNESLPDGKTLLVQQGVNGSEQVTYRQVLENDKEISNNVFKTEMMVEPQPEIMMVGVQKPFTPIPIPGRLAYLSGGNAWVINTSTGNRRPVVTTGDLDGRIFTLSPKGDWLLFTRAEKSTASGQSQTDGATPTPAPTGTPSAATKKINSLWAVDLTTENSKPVNLKVDNVIHFAAWVPGKGLTITYSTVEPRDTAPGWQANNDLQLLSFANTGAIQKQEKILDTNMGGLYGWWGTNFAWSPDGALLAYARPDEIGLVDLEKKSQVPLTTIMPYETGSSWAWVPGLGWSADHGVLYFVTHAEKAGVEKKETSPLFDVSGLPFGRLPLVNNGPLISIIPQAGMFAYPLASPILQGSNYQVAFLQAIFPEQSDSKRYRLAVMDRDGSNRSVIFPPEDQQGLEPDPKSFAWSPSTFDNEHLWLAVIYQGNLWLVDSATSEAQQITGDGLISRVDWK